MATRTKKLAIEVEIEKSDTKVAEESNITTGSAVLVITYPDKSSHRTEWIDIKHCLSFAETVKSGIAEVFNRDGYKVPLTP